MKRLLLLIAVTLCCAHLQAQNVEGQIIASQFGSYQVPGIATGSLQFEPATCQVTGGGKNFAAFTTGVPVKIVDSNPALNEIDTPSNVFISQCAISMSTSHIHATPFYLTSGTGGLQEAIINGPVKGGGPNTVILNADWYAQVSPGSPSAVIAAVTGNTNLGLVDVTTTPYTTYRWNGSQYVINTVTGATIPSTTLVLKGGNALGVAQAATPGTDYVIPTGSVASLNAASALPNNTTATTQATSDSSTKVATDAFVLANAGGASAPATSNVYKGNGTLNGIVAATPGTDYLVPSAIPSTSALLKGSGTAGLSTNAVPGADFFAPLTAGAIYQAPVSTGAGTTYADQTVPVSFGTAQSQYIQQQVTNSNYTTLNVNSLNDEIWVEGFAGGPYTGVGQAQVAWTSGPNQPLCQNVSYSGNNYIAITGANGAVTPGTNPTVWWPTPNTNATNQADCAFASAAGEASARSVQVTLRAGAGTWNMNGFIEPTGLYAVNVIGCGIFCTRWNYTGSAAVPMIYRASNGNNFTFIRISDADFNGGGVASANLDLGHLNQSYWNNMQLHNVAPGSSYFVRTGTSGGDDFQLHASNIVIGGQEDSEAGSSVSVTANVVGGAVTSYTINNGGSNYPVASAAQVYYVQLNGSQGGTATQPCTVMPSGQTVTVVSGVITAVTPGGSNGSGCSGTIDVQVYTYFPVTNAWLNHASDSTFEDITIYAGSPTGYGFWNDGGNTLFTHMHPSFIPNGIYTQTDSTEWNFTELDNVFNAGMTFIEAFSDTAASVVGTQAYGVLPGRIVYSLGTGANVNIAASASLCESIPTYDWYVFMTPTGPITTAAQYSRYPGGSVLGNDTSCGQTMGDYTATLATNSFSPGILNAATANIGTGTFSISANLAPAGTATSGSNFASQPLNLNSSFWNGSAAVVSNWQFLTTLSSGTNPANSFQFVYNPAAGQTATPQIVFPSNAQFPNAATFLNTLSATGLGIANGGTFSNSADNFPNATLINGCNPSTIFTAVQFTQFLTAGLTSCATAPTNSPGANYNQTAGGFFVATTTGIGSGAGQSTAVGASDYAILNGGNNALAFGDNPLVQDVNDGATGQQLIGQEIDVQPQKAATAYANSGFNVIGSSIHLYNQPGQGGIYGPAIFIDTHNFGTPPYWGYGLDTAIAALCPNNCPVLNINAVGQATVGTNFNTPAIFNAYEMYGAGLSEGWTLQGVLNSSTAAAPTADFLQIGHGIGTAPGGQTHSLELMDGILLQENTIYSAAGTALPSCVTALKGAKATVSDATGPTFLGAYTSGGAVVAPVMCNGSGWVTY